MKYNQKLLAKSPISLSPGAISYGGFYFDGEQTMFGQALVNAAMLENQKTPPYLRNPRAMILSRSMYGLIIIWPNQNEEGTLNDSIKN
ncbi:MAG: hypothetical protein R3Y67_01450 [Eubacteriales bacterium]